MYDMYLIYTANKTIKVPCEKCFEKHFVDKSCHRCGGKGVRNKTIEYYKYKRIEVEKIDKANNEIHDYLGEVICNKNELRYWTENNVFYRDHDNLIHFTQKDAERNCKEMNIEKLGKGLYDNYIKE